MTYTLDIDTDTGFNSETLIKAVNTREHFCKSVFLTYSKCQLKLNKFLTAIKNFNNPPFANFYTVRELHKDSILHYYILDKLKKKPNIKNS